MTMATILKSSKEVLYNAIKRECVYQVAKYGEKTNITLVAQIKLAYLELQEAHHAWGKSTDTSDSRCELLQVVACGITYQKWADQFKHEYHAAPTWEQEGFEASALREHGWRLYEVWLEMIEQRLLLARSVAADSEEATGNLGASVLFMQAIGMAMACLMQHGVVERTMLQREVEAVLPFLPDPQPPGMLEALAVAKIIPLGIHYLEADDMELHMMGAYVAVAWNTKPRTSLTMESSTFQTEVKRIGPPFVLFATLQEDPNTGFMYRSEDDPNGLNLLAGEIRVSRAETVANELYRAIAYIQQWKADQQRKLSLPLEENPTNDNG